MLLTSFDSNCFVVVVAAVVFVLTLGFVLFFSHSLFQLCCFSFLMGRSLALFFFSYSWQEEKKM